MIISSPKDHRKLSQFIFGKYYDLPDIPSYLSAVRTLRDKTNIDGKGRILCIGKVGYNIYEQDRIYVVKLGHDGLIFQQVTSLGEQVKEELASAKKQ